jgi:hypothetical protein
MRRFVVCFYPMSQRAEESLKAALSELAKIETRQGELKVLIKARLGDSVNLEDAPEK